MMYKKYENATHNRKGIFCVFLYIAILPLSYVNIGSFGSLYKLASLGLLAIALTDIFSKGNHKYRLGKMDIAWVLYILYCAITLIWTPSSVFYRTTGIITVGLISIVFTFKEFTKDEFDLLKNAWIIASMILVVLFFTRGQELSMSNAGRYTLYITGSIVDANEYAAAFCIGVAITFTNVLDKAKKMLFRICNLIMLILMLYVVLRTGSRGGLVSVLVTIVITAAIALKNNRRAIIVVALLAIIAYVAYTRILPIVLPNSVVSRLSIVSAIESRGTRRFDIWKTNFDMYISGSIFRIIFGYGLSGLSGSVCHNNFLQNLVGLGIIGEILYIRMLYCAFKEFKKANKKIYLGAFCGLIVSSIALTVWSSNKMWWTMFILPLMSIHNYGLENDIYSKPY